MHEKWCSIGSKDERRGIISSTFNSPSIQNQKGAGETIEVCKKQVAIVVESILAKVSQDVNNTETADDTVKNEKRKGQATKKSYTNEFKCKVLSEAKLSTFYDIDIAEKYGLNKSLVSKWKKEAKK